MGKLGHMASLVAGFARKTLNKMFLFKASYHIVSKKMIQYLLVGIKGMRVFDFIYNPKVAI